MFLNWFCSTIDIFSVRNPEYPYDQFIIFNGVDDAIVALTDSVTVMAGEFFTTVWTGVVGKLCNF